MMSIVAIGEARAVHHAADLTVELDVVQRVLGGLGLGRILLVEIAQRLELLVPLERVVVEIHLGIERDHLARAGHDQRVDLDQRAVELGEGLVEITEQRHELADLLAAQAQREGDLAALEGLEARRGIDRLLDDLLRRVVRHALDVHAALGRGDDRDPADRTVDQEREIELALDVAAFLDIEPLHRLAGRAGLLGDQLMAQHRGRTAADLLDRFRDPHAALAVGVVLEAALARPPA